MGEFISQDDLEAVRELLQLVAGNDLGELSVALADGASSSIVTYAASQPPAPAVVYAAPPIGIDAAAALNSPVPAAQSAPVAQSPIGADNRIALSSPMVGIFYASQSPGDPPFVLPGDRIQVGQTIGLIEAMKVFSEIPSDLAGRVVEIAVASGDLVQLGQPLLYVDSA